ncbi:dienelactone hydrolase family protein [Herbiconiux moechotypicola]|uniref:Dienelactone hydrolase domain-containing protein n=1 Tax=Herbiconiux moechotypicola TaxID=637393 RepID=A0ABN3DAD2_9MICO|nr:dienelactone hydrolase family protein [Herbiconiux moechotypicola]MCS5728950.1 dienelactone hydrolase family protein [Herbiconiux moechotypicola]
MTEFIDIPSPGWPLEFGEPGRPGVVIVHDGFGRLPYLEAYATSLAGQGFFALVPDLFDGRATVSPVAAVELESALDEGFAIATIDDAVGMARGQGASRVGVIGLGIGGRLALRLAQSGAVDAVVAYHALLAADEAGIVPCPVLLHRADEDAAAAMEADLFVSRLKEHGTPVTQHSYAAARPGFANATMLELLDKHAAALAFARSTYFLQAQLLD